jgi:hypothetical protein
MTETARIRLTALERAFAEGELTQDERQELETLRDEAGQGWLLDPGSQEPAPEPIPDPGAEIARRLARPLMGHDKGEQADLFGQGLLF